VWSWITKPLDRCAMRSAMGSVQPSPDGNPHIDEAVEMLNRPDFFAPEVAAAELKFGGRDRFEFPSPIPSGCAVNDIVRGKFFPAAGDWRTRPAIILLHGWNAEMQYHWLFPFWGQILARAGVNAFAFELPYHASRRPRAANVIRNFFSGDLLHVMHATRQTLGDLRALARGLYASGAPSVGVWGVSLGGWIAALALTHQPELTSGVLVTPVVRMDRAFRELPFCEPMRNGLEKIDHDLFAPLNPVSHRPLCDERNVLIVSSKHDLFAPAETIDELERAWRCEMWRLNHGHITVLVSSRQMRRVVKWVAARQNVPATAV
jgi:pimeloyl-ACP methyl ester carboxylesterase